MDPRHTDAEDKQFLLNMIAEGQGDAPEQADDDSNTNIYLNMFGDGIEPPSIQVDAAADKVLMYISQLYLFVVTIIFSSKSI